MVDPKGIEPSNLTDANRALSQLSYGPIFWKLFDCQDTHNSGNLVDTKLTTPRSQLSYGPIFWKLFDCQGAHNSGNLVDTKLTTPRSQLSYKPEYEISTKTSEM